MLLVVGKGFGGLARLLVWLFGNSARGIAYLVIEGWFLDEDPDVYPGTAELAIMLFLDFVLVAFGCVCVLGGPL